MKLKMTSTIQKVPERTLTSKITCECTGIQDVNVFNSIKKFFSYLPIINKLKFIIYLIYYGEKVKH
jgi:hypothetical protein